MNALRLALILLAAATMPGAALAGGDPGPIDPQPAASASVPSAPAVPPEGPQGAMMRDLELRMRAQMATVLEHMRASQLELRRDVLAVLTPPQRAFVATTIGELAVAAQRDDAAAAGRIDATLSPAQRQAILQAVATNMTRRAAEFAHLAAQNQLLPPLAQHVPSQPQPQQRETHVSAMPIAEGVGVPFQSYGAAGQSSAGGVILSVLEMPLAQFSTPPVMMLQPH